MTIDSSIYDRAEETAKADYPSATKDDVRKLAEAFQRAYEDWASDMDSANAKRVPALENADVRHVFCDKSCRAAFRLAHSDEDFEVTDTEFVVNEKCAQCSNDIP